MPLKSIYPYFGAKSTVAPYVWSRLGDVPNFVDPFLGSAAFVLSRPDEHRWWERIETANDADGMICNIWRAIQADPDAVASWADQPVSECDLHARHAWLIARKDSIVAKLEGDPDWFDAKIAGWWLWGICSWIGVGWCSSQGPWRVVDGELQNVGGGQKRQIPHLGNAGRGINRQRPHLGGAGAGVGINRQLPNLGNAGVGINRQRPHLGRPAGINRKRPHLGDAGMGEVCDVCAEWSEHLRETMWALRNRFRRVRVCCGDWSRVCGPSPTFAHGLTGVVLDPPYSAEAGRTEDLYSTDDLAVAAKARAWAIDQGNNPLMRIAYFSYGESPCPDGWDRVTWKAQGGYGSQGEGAGRANSARETIDFSPHCIPTNGPAQVCFDLLADEKGEIPDV